MLGSPIRYLQGSGALFLAVLAGCGGRTTTLYPDSDSVAVEPNEPSNGGSSGKTSGTGNATGSPAGGTTGSGATGSATGGKVGSTPGGKGGSPAGGATGTAGAAAGGATGTDPYTFATCTDYCRTQTQGACPNHIPVDQCLSSCVAEAGGRGSLCEKLGNTLLGCLVTAYQNSAGCDDYTHLALSKCSSLISSYENCEGPDIAPVPTPGPVPVPPPNCTSTGSGNAMSCNVTAKCSDGAFYTVSCLQLSAGQSSCTCSSTSANGSGSGASFNLNESVAFACHDSLAACGFPQLDGK